MKKIFLVFACFVITADAFGAISPITRRLIDAQHEMEQNNIQCPDDKPLYVNGGCMSCDGYENWDNVTGIIGCEKCSNSIECFGHCCIDCPIERPVLLSNGACVPCDYKPDNWVPIYDIVKGHDKCIHPEID